MYTIESIFWLKFIFLLTIVTLLVVTFEFVMKKWLRVERESFSYNHVNEKHKKVDWIIRITFLVSMLIGHFYNAKRMPVDKIWYFELLFLMPTFIITSGIVRAFMEWKYAENRKTYILTISQLVFNIILLFIILTNDFFGL